MENNDMIGAVEEYVLQNTKKRMNAGELKAERIEEHDRRSGDGSLIRS